jgi:hypothetical protein
MTPRDPQALAAAFPLLRPGIYRRRILLRRSPGVMRADFEDDPHQHSVEIHHDGRRVTAVSGEALRIPWSACADAPSIIDRLVGMPLSADPLAVFEYTASREQCTHLFDIAGLAVAHAARGTTERLYDVEIPIWNSDSTQHATLRRDGTIALEWDLQFDVRGSTVIGPDRYAGQTIRRLLDWAREHCADPDEFEAVTILRRAVHIAGSRFADLDRHESPAAFAANLPGACYVFRRQGPLPATRMKRSTRDFTYTPDEMLASLRASRRET